MFILNREERNFREEVDDTGRVPVFKTRIYSGPRFGERGTARKPNGIDHPRIRGEGSALGIHLHDDQDNHVATRTFVLEEFSGGSWIDVPLGNYGFNPVQRRWAWGVLEAHLGDDGKFTYDIRPGNGTFRLRSRLTPVSGVPQITLVERGSSIITAARWGNFRSDWSDMLAEIERTEQIGDAIEWVTNGFASNPGQVTTFDPTDTYNTSATQCRASDANDNGTDPIKIGGDAFAFAQRSWAKFDITSLPAANVTSQVDLNIEINNVDASFASNNRQGDIRGYNGAGATDPAGDSGANQYTRSDGGNAYITNSTVFQTTGSKTFTLATQAETDIDAARDAGTIWSVGFSEINDVSSSGEDSEWEGEGATNEPTIDVTHAAAGGTNPKGPLGHPLHGAFGGPIGA